MRKVVQSVKSEYQAALAQERSLVGALESQKAEALGLNRKGIEYQRAARAKRRATGRSTRALLQRTKETGISGELKTSNIRVVDSAEVPSRPILPQPAARPARWLACRGCVLAIGLVFLFEYLDNRIKSPQELRAHLGLPFLGMVPAIDAAGRRW